jgi:hypothetical protein
MPLWEQATLAPTKQVACIRTCYVKAIAGSEGRGITDEQKKPKKIKADAATASEEVDS